MATNLSPNAKSKTIILISQQSNLIGGMRMQELLNYDYLPSNIQQLPVRASQPLASFQRDFSQDLNPPQYQIIPSTNSLQPNAAGFRVQANRFEEP